MSGSSLSDDNVVFIKISWGCQNLQKDISSGSWGYLVDLVNPVYLVYFVCFVYLVCMVEIVKYR